jgi:hypothetical protein
MIASSVRTKLEAFLLSRPNNLADCSCENSTSVLILRNTAYIGCSKCGKPSTRQATMEQIPLIQNGDLA